MYVGFDTEIRQGDPIKKAYRKKYQRNSVVCLSSAIHRSYSSADCKTTRKARCWQTLTEECIADIVRREVVYRMVLLRSHIEMCEQPGAEKQNRSNTSVTS